MTERFSSADVSHLCLEGRTTPQHLGALSVFEPPADGFDYDRLVRLLEERICLVPRSRQRMRTVPGRLASPVWVDDPRFEITYHVRRSTLARPGDRSQLLEFCARIQSRLLDRDRPLWELYLIDGMADGRIAILTKTHLSMANGPGAIDIGQVILDASPVPGHAAGTLWMPEPEPSATDLVIDALAAVLRRPGAMVDTARLGLSGVRACANQASGTLASVVSAGVGLVRPARSPSPSARTVPWRGLAAVRTPLADYQLVGAASGSTEHDVILATVAGALRGWLLRREAPLPSSLAVRALMPASNNDAQPVPIQPRSWVVELPVGEPSPLRRLAQIRTTTAAHGGSAGSMNAEVPSGSGLRGSALRGRRGLRSAHRLTHRAQRVALAQVPGPRQPRYVAGARMTQAFPIPAIGAGQAMAIGFTCYDGGVFYGVNGTRDGGPDAADLVALLEQSLAELVEASSLPAGARAVTGRPMPHRRPGILRGAARPSRGRRA